MNKGQFLFHWPKKTEIVLIDSSGSDLLEKFILKNKFSVIDINSLNIFVLIRMLIKGNKSLFHYTIAYIKTFKPRFVFTFIDNNVDFYKLASKFPETKFFAIQNGFRANYANQLKSGIFDQLETLAKIQTPRAASLCVLGNAAGEQYAKYIDTNIVVTGSLKNNCIGDSLDKVQHYDIVYISQHAPFDIATSHQLFFFGSEFLSATDFYSLEKQIVCFLSNYCKKAGLTFAVLGKRTATFKPEKQFFIDAAQTNPFEFIPKESDTSTYEYCNAASVIVTADSTIGYEFLARSKRVAFFSARLMAVNAEIAKNHRDTNFGYPLQLDQIGPFWTNTPDINEFERIIGFLHTVSDSEWASIISPYNEALMAYQPNNHAFVDMLRIEGVPLRSEVISRA